MFKDLCSGVRQEGPGPKPGKSLNQNLGVGVGVSVGGRSRLSCPG